METADKEANRIYEGLEIDEAKSDASLRELFGWVEKRLQQAFDADKVNQENELTGCSIAKVRYQSARFQRVSWRDRIDRLLDNDYVGDNSRQLVFDPADDYTAPVKSDTAVAPLPPQDTEMIQVDQGNKLNPEEGNLSTFLSHSHHGSDAARSVYNDAGR